MSVFILNAKKVSQDFGSVAKMAKAYNIAQPTLEHIIYRKPSLNFCKDSVRETVNELLAQGYLYYADEIDEPSSKPQAKVVSVDSNPMWTCCITKE